MTTKIVACIVSFVILLVTVELVRRERLTFKYAFGWIIISALAIFLTVFDKFLYAAAKSLGFELTSNFIFFALLGFFVFLSLLLTTFLCQQDIRNDIIAQKIGILEMELSQLKERLPEHNKLDR